jgi:hypothetical protein
VRQIVLTVSFWIILLSFRLFLMLLAHDPKILRIAEWLDKQAMDNSISDGTIWQSMALSKRTFYRLKPKALAIVTESAKKRQKLVTEAKDSATIEAAVKGLKSKAERLLILQDQIDGCLDDLNKKKVTVFEKVALRKAIKELQSEISKIEGDYAPTKQANTNSAGEDVPPEKPYSKTELIEILKAANA